VTDPTGRRKDSQLTLQRMRQATLTLLDTSGYEELRLSDIEEASGLTRGAIYHHYKDKRELVLSIVSERLADITLALERVEIRPGDAAFASLLALNAVFVDAFSASRALMKTLYHLEEVDADFGAYYQQVRGGWATTLAEKLESLCDGAIPARKDIAAFAFLAMTDRFLYDIYSLR
ncbi:TetR/AcrR family transcriptional regulator, partial [Maribellus luteus]